MLTSVVMADDNELILYLPFNEGSGSTAYDQSGYGNNAALVNTSWSSGYHDYGVSLDNSINGSYTLVILDSWESLNAVQGVCSDGTYIYTSTNSKIYKYDMDGDLITSSETIPSGHLGGICYYGGNIYGAWHSGNFSVEGDASKIKVFDASDLSFTTESGDLSCGYGAGAITYNYDNDSFYVPESFAGYWDDGRVFEFNSTFSPTGNYTVHTGGNINYGFQGISYLNGYFLLTDHEERFWKTDDSFSIEFELESGIEKMQGVDWIDADECYISEQYNGNVYQVRIEGSTGNDAYVTIIEDFFSSLTEYTMVCWFRWDGGGGGADGRKFLWETYPTYYASDLFILSDNRLRTAQYYSDNTELAWESILTVEPNNWYFAVLVWEKGEYIRVYVNGTKYIDGTPDDKALKETTGLNIGTYRDVNNRWFSGVIDEIKIYNYALSLTQINNLYTYNALSIPVATVPPDQDLVIDFYGSGDVSLLSTYLIAGDLLGFIMACYTTRIGQVFYAILALIITIPLAIRTQSITYVALIWLLLGGLFMWAVPTIFGVGTLFIILAIASLLYKLFAGKNE